MERRIEVVFFFQAEDGIRDGRVTGVQTCALPISAPAADRRSAPAGAPACGSSPACCGRIARPPASRSPPPAGDRADRKSTRLNSSHPSISYAVFCLKKKKKLHKEYIKAHS